MTTSKKLTGRAIFWSFLNDKKMPYKPSEMAIRTQRL